MKMLKSEYKQLTRIRKGKKIQDSLLSSLSKNGWITKHDYSSDLSKPDSAYHPEITIQGEKAMEEYRQSTRAQRTASFIAWVSLLIALVSLGIDLLQIAQ